MKTAAVLTVSDSSFQGSRADLSGPAVVRLLREAGFEVVRTGIVPDERGTIQSQLLECCRQARLVVTVGGTGIAPRDVTPEATLAVAERVIAGIAEKMRSEGAKKTPLAALSRGICGTKGNSLLLNLPGSPAAATESLDAVLAILPHALDLLEGNTAH
ncbi:MAG TPA: MogA/MoaB family molybdenum cofactor biosynthesis protein [Candidatus Angelobacter sp.]|nr:MogA/MoaB family molybdenum cofactor biosynthesis protein [Candidatus Angelobacter sp.]